MQSPLFPTIHPVTFTPFEVLQVHSSSTESLTEISPPKVNNGRLTKVLEKPITLKSKEGYLIGTVNLKSFLKELLYCLDQASVKVKAIEVTGGGVAYLIGPEAAAEYALTQKIENPSLHEFDRLNDIDISIDLSDHLKENQDVLWTMRSCVVKALKRCGIVGTFSELLDSIFFRSSVFLDVLQGLTILSFGDSKKFWVDLSFFTHLPRRHLFIRDDLRIDILSLLRGQNKPLICVSESGNPWMAVRNRLEKKLDIYKAETINHVGFLLSCLYLAQNYQTNNLNTLLVLAQCFISWHAENSISYMHTFEKVRKNHMGSDLELYEKMMTCCLRLLLFSSNSQFKDFLQQIKPFYDTKEGRLIQFLQNNGVEHNNLRPIDLLCLADIMGVQPKLPLLKEFWKIFFQRKIALSAKDTQLLFNTSDSLGLIIAKKIHAGEWNPSFGTTQEVLDLLEKWEWHEDKAEFLNLKFEWGMNNNFSTALGTYRDNRKYLTLNRVNKFLNSLFRIPSSQIKDVLKSIFNESLDQEKWLDKLTNEGCIPEALDLVLATHSEKIYVSLLNKFQIAGQLKVAIDLLGKIGKKDQQLYHSILKHIFWDEIIENYAADEKNFVSHLNGFISSGEYQAAEKLLKANGNDYELPASWVEKIIEANYMQAFEQSDFDRFSFLIQQGIRSKIDKVKLQEIFGKILLKLTDSPKDDSKDIKGLSVLMNSSFLPYSFYHQNLFISLVRSCYKNIPLHLLENTLRVFINSYITSLNVEVLEGINLILKSMQVNRRRITSDMHILLSETAEVLLKSKNLDGFLLFLKEVQGFKIILNLSQLTSNLIKEIRENPTVDAELLKVLTQVYDLSEEVERNLLQVYLKQLSLSNPSLAVNYFNRKSHLWIGQKEVLKVFFDSIPLESSLKLELLFLLSEWNREMWLDMVNLPDRDIDTHYRLLVDARARLFVDKTMLYRFVGDKRGTLRQSQQLIHLFQIPCHEELGLIYLNRLNDEKYPVLESIQFLEYLSKERWVLSTKFITLLKNLIQKISKSNSFVLLDVLQPLNALIDRVPQEQKNVLINNYFTLLPFDFDEQMYTAEQRAILNQLQIHLTCKCPFSAYLGITSDSLDTIEIAFKDIIHNKWFKKNNTALILMLKAFSQILSLVPELWESYEKLFLKGYLLDGKTNLSSTDRLNGLEKALHPELNVMYLNYALKANHPDYNKQALVHFKNLIDKNQWVKLGEFVSHNLFSNWIRSGNISLPLKGLLEEFFVKLLDSRAGSDTTETLQMLNWLYEKIDYCDYKNESFSLVLNSLANCLAQAMLKVSDFQEYYTFIELFIAKMTPLLGSKQSVGKIKKSKARKKGKAASASEIDDIPPILSRFQLNIINILAEYFNSDKLDFIILIYSLLQSVILKIQPEASESLCASLYNFFRRCSTLNFPNSPIYNECFETLEFVFQAGLFKDNYGKLIEMGILFLSIDDKGNNDFLSKTMGFVSNILELLLNDSSFTPGISAFRNIQPTMGYKTKIDENFLALLLSYYFRLPPSHSLNETERSNFFKHLYAIFSGKWSIAYSKEMNAMRIYLKSTDKKLSSDLFCDGFNLILQHIPRTNLASRFNHLIEVYHYWIFDIKMTLTPALIQTYGKILNLLPVEIASQSDMNKIVYSVQCYKQELPQISENKNAFVKEMIYTFIPWHLLSERHSLSINHLDAFTTVISLFLEMDTARGFYLALVGFIDKHTQCVVSKCNSLPPSADIYFGIQKLFLAILTKSHPDIETRMISEPKMKEICIKLLTILRPVNQKAILYQLTQERFSQNLFQENSFQDILNILKRN